MVNRVKAQEAHSVGGGPRNDFMEQNLTRAAPPPPPPVFLSHWLVPIIRCCEAWASGLGKLAGSFIITVNINIIYCTSAMSQDLS